MHFMRVLSWLMSLTLAANGSVQPIGVGPVEYSGEVPEYFQQEIERALIAAIEQAHGEAIELSVESCMRLECLQEPAAQAKLEVVLLPRVTKQGRDYRVELVAYSVADKTMLARVEGECSVCGQQELLDFIPAEVVELHAKLSAALAARHDAPRLAVDGKPRGATLTLDGEDLGVSPVTLEIAPGDHQLQITAAGHHAQIHRWVAAAGVEVLVSYRLTPSNPSDAGRGLRIGGGLAVALGLAGTGTGVALLVLDGREHRPTCNPDLAYINGACPNIYATATAGYVSLGLGLAAIGVGAGLLIHERLRTSRHARVRVTTAGINVQF
jgi:hypothetical protein